MKAINRILAVSLAMLAISVSATAQRYQEGLVDKTVAVIGNEAITISDIEAEVQVMRAQGSASDMRMRCDILQQMMESKLFLMQARVDSLTVNADMVETQLSQRIDKIRAALGGDENVAEYFGKPVYKLRQEWKQQLEDMSLTQQEQNNIADVVPAITPYDVKKYIESVDESQLPIVPDKYQLSQICVYPDREAAASAVKEKLIELRERIHNGDKFATLARLYSEDIASARKGGELGMTPKSQFWPQFSDAAMALRPGVISQVVETPDGFHIIEMLEKKGDEFNARHILMRPVYTAEDQEKGFALLDSLRSEIMNKAVTFELAARFYSEDSATKTNGGQMADPNTGSAYFEVDQLKPQDYEAIKDLKVGEISQPFASLDNEGRDGNLVYKIVRLDKVVPSHVATFENDFTQLSEMVMYDKQQEAIDNFIDEKLKTTYIVIDPLFKDCQFDRPAWNDKIRSE